MVRSRRVGESESWREESLKMSRNRKKTEKIIFLDRDGVINEYPGYGNYVTSWKGFKFIKGAKKAIALLTKRGYRIFIISSQAGVSKGIFKKKDLNDITKRMLSAIKKSGGRIKKVLYCIHEEKDKCNCKKPKTGLFKKAIGRRKVNLREIYFVGDDKGDVEAARNLGCKGILVFSGKTIKKELHGWEFLPDITAHDLLDAAKRILQG